MYKNGPDYRDDGTVVSHSRVITWRRTVTESYYDSRSVVSRSSNHSLSKQASAPPTPTVVSKAPSTASKAPSVARSVSEPVAVPQVPAASETSNNGSGIAKHIVGTLLGAAAGAAVAYAMVASERDSAKKEAEFNAFKVAKAAVNSVAQFAQGSEQPKPPVQDPQPVYEMPQPVHRNNDNDTASQYAPSQARTVRAIEAAPSWHGPLYTKAPSVISVSRQIEYAPAESVAPSRSPQSEYVPAASVAPSKAPSRASSRASEPKAIEYVPAASVAPSTAPSRAAELRAIEYAPAPSVAPSTRSIQRSMTSPELATSSKAKSTVSKAQSAAPSSFISTFVPDEFQRRNTDDGSVASHRSSKSRSKSHHSSKHRSSSRSRAHSRSPSRAPSEAPSKPKSKVGSVIGSILGRNSDNRSVISNPFGDKYEVDDYTSEEDDAATAAADDDDNYTIAPSDSISQVSSSRSRRSHRSHRHRSKDDDDTKSSASARSKHSSSSKHSSRSHRSKGSSYHSSQYHTAEEDFRSSVASEASDASTIRPHGHSSSSSSSSHHRDKASKARSSRKDSATEYDEMFDKVQYGSGNVPVRGITPSMVQGKHGAEEGKSKSMVGWKMAQRLRAFEGN